MNILKTVERYLDDADRRAAADAASAAAFQARLDPVTCAALKAVAAELYALDAEWSVDESRWSRAEENKEKADQMAIRAQESANEASACAEYAATCLTLECLPYIAHAHVFARRAAEHVRRLNAEEQPG